MRKSFEHVPDGTFFRKPGLTGIFRKIPVRYESTREVNVQSKLNTLHFMNGAEQIIIIKEDDPLPTWGELGKE